MWRADGRNFPFVAIHGDTDDDTVGLQVTTEFEPHGSGGISASIDGTEGPWFDVSNDDYGASLIDIEADDMKRPQLVSAWTKDPGLLVDANGNLRTTSATYVTTWRTYLFLGSNQIFGHVNVIVGTPSSASAEGLISEDDVVVATETLDYLPTRGGRLSAGRRLREIIGRRHGGNHDVITIEGEEFSEGLITVELGGYQKSFSLWEDPDERGHPMKVVLDTAGLEQDENGPIADEISKLLAAQAIPAGHAHA